MADNLEKEIFDALVQKMKLQSVVAELPPEKLTYDTPLLESMDPDGLALDSMEVLDMIIILEDSFDITVEDEDMIRLTSVQNIADLIREIRGERS